MNSEDQVHEIKVVCGPEEGGEETPILKHVKDVAEEGSVEDLRQMGAIGFETVILALVAGHYLVDLIIKISREWRPGVVVDMTGPKVLIEQSDDPGLRGVILIHQKDGTTTKIQRNKVETSSDLLKNALSAF